MNNDITFLLVSLTTISNCFYTLVIILYSLFFCNKVFSNYSKVLGWLIILMCSGFLILNCYNPIFCKLHTITDLLVQNTWFCIGTILYAHVHRLELYNRETELHSKTTRYLGNDYSNRTLIFDKPFMECFWDFKSVKGFIKNKVLAIEIISWVLLIFNIIEILIIKIGEALS